MTITNHTLLPQPSNTKNVMGCCHSWKNVYGGVTCGVAIVERMLWGVTYSNNQS